MELAKLERHAVKIRKNREMFKYISLGLIPVSVPMPASKTAEKLINQDSCLHQQNSNEVLLTQFPNEIPSEDQVQKINRFYDIFIKKVAHIINSGQGEGREHGSEMKTHGGKDQEEEDMGERIAALARLDEQVQKKLDHHDRKFVAVLAQCMVQVYDEADKLEQIKKFKAAKLQKQLQKLYIQTHKNYLQLMQLKSAIDESSKILIPQLQPQHQSLDPSGGCDPSVRKKSLTKMQRNLADPKLLKQYDRINSRIATLKSVISARQEEETRVKMTQANAYADKIQFLKLLLVNGYHQADGIWWILAKLASNNEKLEMADLCCVIDGITKKFVIQEYEVLKAEIWKKKKDTSTALPKIKILSDKEKAKDKTINDTFYKSKSSHSNLRSISVEQPSTRIYKEAKSYIVDWVKQERWKIRSLKHRTPQKKHTCCNWKHQQLERIRETYPKQRYQRIFLYLFGTVKPDRHSLDFGFYLKDIKPNEIIHGQEFLQAPQYQGFINRSNTTK